MKASSNAVLKVLGTLLLIVAAMKAYELLTVYVMGQRMGLSRLSLAPHLQDDDGCNNIRLPPTKRSNLFVWYLRKNNDIFQKKEIDNEK